MKLLVITDILFLPYQFSIVENYYSIFVLILILHRTFIMAKENKSLLLSLLFESCNYLLQFLILNFNTVKRLINIVQHIKRNPSRSGKGSNSGGRYLSLIYETLEGILHSNSGDSLRSSINTCGIASGPLGLSETRFQRINYNLSPWYAGLGCSFC